MSLTESLTDSREYGGSLAVRGPSRKSGRHVRRSTQTHLVYQYIIARSGYITSSSLLLRHLPGRRRASEAGWRGKGVPVTSEPQVAGRRDVTSCWMSSP